MPYHHIKEIIEDIRQGKMVIMMDDEHRENEGDIVMAASKITPWHLNFMLHFARGIICLPMSEQHRRQLALPMMVSENRCPFGTNFTVSIEAASGVTTGVSVQDRAKTILSAAHPAAKPSDLIQPGHVFPLVAREGGVLTRQGHTEASVDLVKLAGMGEVAVICEVLDEEGNMARNPQLTLFAQRHGLKLGTIHDLVEYRKARLESKVSELI